MISISPIRHVAVSLNGNVFATAEFEKVVSTWEGDTGQPLATFRTGLDFGGRRLTLSPDGTLCAIGAYGGAGVAVHQARTGERVWLRKDLKRVQWLGFDPHLPLLRVGFDETSMQVLSSETGDTIERLRGVRKFFSSSLETETYFLDSAIPRLHSAFLSKPVRINRTTFAILDATFGPDTLFVTESVGPIRAFDCRTGQRLWECRPSTNKHCLRLSYHVESGSLFGVQFDLQDASHSFIQLEARSGAVMRTFDLENVFLAEFGGLGALLVTSKAEIWNLKGTTNLQLESRRFALIRERT